MVLEAMADDVVVLSSDDSDASDSVFVTPHPRSTTRVISTTIEDAHSTRPGGLGEVAALVAGGKVAGQDGPRAAADHGQGTPAAQAVPARHAAVIAIEDTPAPPAQSRPLPNNRSARARFPAFSSDDALSSPFPELVPTRRLLSTHRQTDGESLIRHGNGTGKLTGEEQSRVVLPDDGCSVLAEPQNRPPHRGLPEGDDLDIGQPRPAKRQRLSPNANDDAALPAWPLVASPGRQGISHATCRPNGELGGRQQDKKQDKTGPTVECIELLSSSDSEAARTAPPKAKAAAVPDSDFMDIDDLLMQSSPPPRQGPPRMKSGGSTTGGRGHSPVEIRMFSSPPRSPYLDGFPALQRPAPNGGRGHGAASGQPTGSTENRTAADRALTSHRRQPMQRSLSEGHALVLDEDDDDDWLGGDGFSVSRYADDLLATWGRGQLAQQRHGHRPDKAGPAAARRRASLDGSERGPGYQARPRQKTDRPTDDAERERRQREKDASREEKRKEKEAERERRQQEREVERERRKIASEMAKERKAQERAEAAAFNNANRSRVDKAVAAPEMTVRLPETLPQATKEVAETMLDEIKSSHEVWTSPVDGVVAWRRKVTAEYKASLGHWVPVAPRIEEEKHALVVVRGEDFVQLILARENPEIRRHVGHSLDSHVQAMKSNFPDHRVIYLIEGLGAWKSKNRAMRNREFAAAVRSAGGGRAVGAASGASSQPQPPLPPQQAARPSQRLGHRGQPQPTQHLDEAVVEDALLELQVEHEGLLIHETQSSLDTARWIKIFTEQIATAPYRQLKEEMYAAAASFCMDSGQIATGDGAADTYALMLQQIGRVTEPVALGVAARFDSVPKLLRGLADEGPLALEACLKSRNRNGALSDRTVGPALSRRIYKVFMGQDEKSTDV